LSTWYDDKTASLYTYASTHSDCLSFSFQRSRAHRDLHSFPTRRSSDLAMRTMLEEAASDAILGVEAYEARRTTSGAESRRTGPRSEEHTSELQSLRHLVCRLLLEKKKKTEKNTSRT